MARRVLLGAILAGLFCCVLGGLIGTYIGYLRQFDKSLVQYQRDLWSYAAIFWGSVFGIVLGGFGVLVGALAMYWRARRT